MRGGSVRIESIRIDPDVAFDYFMEGITNIEIVSNGTYGITLLIESDEKHSKYVDHQQKKVTKLLIKVCTITRNRYDFDIEEYKKIMLVSSTIKEFEDEIETQEEFYFGSMVIAGKSCESAALCPAIVYTNPNYDITYFLEKMFKNLEETTKKDEGNIHKMLNEINIHRTTLIGEKLYLYSILKRAYERQKYLKRYGFGYLHFGIIVMEYLDGYVIIDNSMDEVTRRKYFVRAIYVSIMFAKITKKTHNDLHAGNFLVKDDKLLLIDFGNSKSVEIEETGLNGTLKQLIKHDKKLKLLYSAYISKIHENIFKGYNYYDENPQRMDGINFEDIEKELIEIDKERKCEIIEEHYDEEKIHEEIERLDNELYEEMRMKTNLNNCKIKCNRKMFKQKCLSKCEEKEFIELAESHNKLCREDLERKCWWSITPKRCKIRCGKKIQSRNKRLKQIGYKNLKILKSNPGSSKSENIVSSTIGTVAKSAKNIAKSVTKSVKSMFKPNQN